MLDPGNPGPGPGYDFAGPNDHLNAPVLTSATSGNARLVQGVYHGDPLTSFAVDVFSTPAGSPGSAARGKTIFGTATIRTDFSGQSTFARPGSFAGLPATDRVTATATNLRTGDTSAFSAPITAGTSIVVDSTADAGGGGGSLRAALAADRAYPGPDTITFNLPASNPLNSYTTQAIGGGTEPSAPTVAPDSRVWSTDPIAGYVDAVDLSTGILSTLAQPTAVGHPGPIVVDRDGNPVFAASPDTGSTDNLGFVNVDDGSVVYRTLTSPTGNGITGLAQRPDGRIAVTFGGNGTVDSFVDYTPTAIQPIADLGTIYGGGTAIDGTTQPGFAGTPIVTIDGRYYAGGVLLYIQGSGGDTLRGLVVNDFAGTLIQVGPGTAGELIVGNYFGTDASGTRAAGGGLGVLIDAADATIGGGSAAERNLFDGSRAAAALTLGVDSVGDQVLGNYVGLNAAGTATIRDFDGIDVLGRDNFIGEFLQGNVIAGSLGATATTDGIGVILDGPGARDNLVQANLIGTNALGTAPLGNSFGIVARGGATANVVGGSFAGAGNLISGNTGDGGANSGYGIDVLDVASADNTIHGNTIGLNLAGNAKLPNSYGILIVNATGTTIGGTGGGDTNVISGNANYGILIADPASSLNTIANNFIGIDLGGTHAAANLYGVGVVSGDRTTIGGPDVASRNVISGNMSYGIYVAGFVNGSARRVSIHGNYIGTDASGTSAVPNRAGGTQVGGPTPGQGNLISGNDGDGVLVVFPGGVYNPLLVGAQVRGNVIGLDALGTHAPGNTGSGVHVAGLNSAQIGGTAAGEGNVIADNGSADPAHTAGVLVNPGSNSGVDFAPILGNTIFDNAGLGFDVVGRGATYGVTDSGSLPFPVITGFTTRPGAGTRIGFTLTAPANTTYAVEFFATKTPDPSGHVEASRRITPAGIVNSFTTDAGGNIEEAIIFPGVYLPGLLAITATATPVDNSDNLIG